VLAKKLSLALNLGLAREAVNLILSHFQWLITELIHGKQFLRFSFEKSTSSSGASVFACLLGDGEATAVAAGRFPLSSQARKSILPGKTKTART
jgi:hypothetical protein